MEDNFNKELNEQIEKLNVGSDTPMQNFSTPTQPQNTNLNITGETNYIQPTPVITQPNKKKLPVWAIITLCLVAGMFLPTIIYFIIFLAPINKNKDGSPQSTLGALQSSQKATQMKQDVFKVQDTIHNYKLENQGKSPTVEQLNAGELGRFESVDGDNYIFVEGKISQEISEKKDGKQIIYIYKGAECTTNNDVIPSSKLNLAINKKLNTGENYCLSL